MRFHIISLFPKAFDSYLGESIIKRAIEDKIISVKFYNPRDFSDNKFRHIDQKPYAGGPGMVIEALPVVRAVESAVKASGSRSKIRDSRMGKSRIKIVWLTPSGKQFDTSYAKKTAEKYTDIIVVCGRYEGIDARARK